MKLCETRRPLRLGRHAQLRLLLLGHVRDLAEAAGPLGPFAAGPLLRLHLGSSELRVQKWQSDQADAKP